MSNFFSLPKFPNTCTRERIYLETLEKTLGKIDKIIVDKNAGSGIVPYLPLPELKKKDRNTNQDKVNE